MSSTDESVGSKQDSVLLFQFSRPQNLIKFWKFKIEIALMRFLDTDPAILLVVNKNGEMQRIYCCDSAVKLKRHSKEKAERVQAEKATLEERAAKEQKVDYKFMENEQRLGAA
mmetsp:Transcript_29931/g.34984  ORF Transcript_29931/g.34984 Transcript_29931/m.34984 type:complete len:113 (-) Transcript_29931:423-761(-)|eukprot:CAMPEP_0185617488 /NCGR_PEP_ID=MMETSP0436-20130131/43698_1 /TAXON_ID=626734 ORGANISM="Favella taraikaensis, Strain Fe Narragansett Bay" /NCGR_SAMPLE_ID=MMETSP0436 /ASSEMBLY_ACC=CAM_ASM_000390 /LENGTH=112 /DNA_ID=CAMNT_0028255205 /DNA_START=143 /DNA_END=481 /DNA_ORIENTATION=-